MTMMAVRLWQVDERQKLAPLAAVLVTRLVLLPWQLPLLLVVLAPTPFVPPDDVVLLVDLVDVYRCHDFSRPTQFREIAGCLPRPAPRRE